VRNDTTTALMTVADLHTVWVAADVPENVIRKIEVGEGIQVELYAYPGETFRGRVARIADTVDPQTRTIKVQTELENPGGRLRPEMFGQIRHSHGNGQFPAAPAGAVLQFEGHEVLIVEESPGRFRQVTVTVGPRQGDMLPVLAGLREKARIVVDGAMLLP
jgi:membrane fusion protein, heavy metal efflux system